VRGAPTSGVHIEGTPPTAVWPLFEFAAEARTPDDRFVIEGEVVHGGITVGLVHNHSWTADGNLTVTKPGPFIAVLAPTARGEYGVLCENGLYGSWFLRNAPKPIVAFAGRLHDFNDVRISKAGWVQRENE
jgi:hypothetical protein